jgi:hypothetical protein
MENGSMRPRSRLPLIVLVALLLVAARTTAASAHAPPPDVPPAADGLLAPTPPIEGQPRSATTCDGLTNATDQDDQLVLTDADLEPGATGSRLCLYWDGRWASYFVVLINQRTLAEFRATKARLQPLLAAAGIDLCLVAFWTAPESAIQRGMSAADRQDAGRRCEPVIITHGPLGGQMAEELREALAAAAGTAERLMDWPLTWPIRAHVYDDHDTFVRGAVEEGGNSRATPQSLQNVRGMAGIIANGMRGFLVDASGFTNPRGLQALIAHEYFHIVQAAVLGCTCNGPFWAIEGGAEYFAALVAGAEERSLVRRYQAAASDEYTGQAVPLTQLRRQPPESDRTRTLAAYTRGYAAFRFLALTWGEDAFARLHRAPGPGSVNDYLDLLAAITGLSLDDFDTALGAFLREEAVRLPSLPLPEGARLEPNSLLTYVATARALGHAAFDETDRFTRFDRGLTIVLEWRCTTAPVMVEVVLVTPTGQRFGVYRGTVGPGCGLPTEVEFRFDDGPAARSARAFPGVWRVDVIADGVAQGSATFTLEP